MPKEKTRLSYSLDEVFGAMPVPQHEIELMRTNGTPLDPNWNGPMKEFGLGLQNSKETVLSNMIATKTQGSSLTLSEFLDFLHTSQIRLFDFIIRIIDRITPKEKEDKEDITEIDEE